MGTSASEIFDIPRFYYFKSGNNYSGSKGNFTYKIENGEQLKCLTWQGRLCSSKAEIENEQEFEEQQNIGFTMSLPEITEQMGQVCIAKDFVLCTADKESVNVTTGVNAVIRIVDGSGETVYESAMLMLTVEPGKVNEQIME